MSIRSIIRSIFFFTTPFYLLSAFSGCEIINPEEQIPAYIHIDSIKLNTSGNGPHNIVDAWVYINGQSAGVYELPATFPVLNSGENELQILPGIKMNGISNTRIPYPFFEEYTITKDLFPDSIVEIKPTTSYSTAFVWDEDFENVGITLQQTSQSDTTVQRLSNDPIVFQGNGCGAFILGENQDVFEGISSQTFSLPQNGQAIFLEINYKCNNHFAVGVYANTQSSSIQNPPSIWITPKEEWNKIYINLTQEVVSNQDAIDFNVYFGVLKDPEVNQAEVYVDNIKLIHF